MEACKYDGMGIWRLGEVEVCKRICQRCRHGDVEAWRRVGVFAYVLGVEA